MIIECLDKGFVRLVSFMGSDLDVSRAARVSYAAEGREEDKKLIHYLWKNKHTSPFEACTLTLEVKAPIFVFRQWHRHRTQSYNEVSARYTELPDEFYVPDPMKIGLQSKDNKQARVISAEEAEDSYAELQEDLVEYRLQCEDSFRLYKQLLAQKWPRELARMILPLSTYSHMFTTMNLLNCFRFLELRLHEHAQYEIRVYAQAIHELLKGKVPICVEAFDRFKFKVHDLVSEEQAIEIGG